MDTTTYVDVDALAEREDPHIPAPDPGRASAAPVPRPLAQEVVAGIESIRRARRAGKQYSSFVLEHTGGTAKVKRPSLLAMAAAGVIPQHLRALVDQMVARGVTTNANPADELTKDGKTIENVIDLVNATCIAGFVNPLLVPTGKIMFRGDPGRPEAIKDFPGIERWIGLEEKGWVRLDAENQPITDPLIMFVDEIELDDRSAFFGWCNREGVQEAAQVASFPEPPPPSVVPGLRGDAV